MPDGYRPHDATTPLSTQGRLQIMQRDGYRCTMCGRLAGAGVLLDVDDADSATVCFDCKRGKSPRTRKKSVMVPLFVVFAALCLFNACWIAIDVARHPFEAAAQGWNAWTLNVVFGIYLLIAAVCGGVAAILRSLKSLRLQGERQQQDIP